MRPLTILSVTRLGSGLYTLRLERPPDQSRPFAAPFIPYAQVQIDDDVVQFMRGQIGQAVEHGGARAQCCEAISFVDTCRALFDTLLPSGLPGVRDLRDAIQGLSTPLLVSTSDQDIPWELLHDGEGFWGVKHALGRGLRDTWQSGPCALISGEDEHRCLIVADPSGDLPSAVEEMIALRRLVLDRGFECECLTGAEATLEAVLNRLMGRGLSMFHFAGHVVLEQGSEEYALALAGRRSLGSSAIERFTRAPEMVFLNGSRSTEMLGGITKAFLKAGSRLVLGSLFAAPSRGTASSSQAFYRAFFDGQAAGEAARLARKLGRESADSDGAWACLVLYGDPRFALGADPLVVLLKSMGMQRNDFAVAALADLERAGQFAGPAGMVTASKLFAALVSGEDSHVRDRLRSRGVSPQHLEEAFGSAFSAALPAPRHTPLSASASVREVLQQARAAALSCGRTAICELDLVRGFVNVKGSSAWRILRNLRVRPVDLDPDQGARTVARAGPLIDSDCEPGAWSVLLTAASLAEAAGTLNISTSELFAALLSVEGGLLQGALTRLGIPFQAFPVTVATSMAPGAKGKEVACSENASQILTMAQASAAAGRGLVTEADLMTAFVDAGGGHTGASLQRQGVMLRALTSTLFLAGGLLDTERFDQGCQRILEITAEFARKKEYGAIGRSHLLFGFLSSETGAFSSRLKEQQFDSEQLADLFHATFPMGGAPGAQTSLRYSNISAGLLKILCSAESTSRRDSEPKVSETNLLEAWVEDGGGSGGSFLVRNGVKLRRFR